MAETNEARYWAALKRISSFDRPEKLRRNSEKSYGLEYSEALEYAYENVIEAAKSAIRGRRKPKEIA
jgi:hypothetical protein